MNKNSNLYILVQYLTAILLVVAIPSYSESAAECDAPREVCDWRSRIVGIKTPNMIASGILIEDGFIVTNRHVVEDHQSILVKNFYGDIDKVEVIPHGIPVDLAIVTSGRNKITPDVSKL